MFNKTKISTIFNKTTKDSNKVKRIENYVLKCNLYLYFLIQQKFLISSKKVLILAERMSCVTQSIYFLSL